MGHDQRFKEFLHAFLRDFLRLFFSMSRSSSISEAWSFSTPEFSRTDPRECPAKPTSLPSSKLVTATRRSF